MPFLKKSIGQYALWHLAAREFTADGDNRNLRKALAHYGKELKPIHVGHLQIGNDDIRGRLPERKESLKAVTRTEHFITLRLENCAS